jgi:hypothetical protein
MFNKNKLIQTICIIAQLYTDSQLKNPHKKKEKSVAFLINIIQRVHILWEIRFKLAVKETWEGQNEEG